MSYMHIFMTDAPYRVTTTTYIWGRSSSLKVASTCLTWQSWFDLAFKINSGSQIIPYVYAYLEPKCSEGRDKRIAELEAWAIEYVGRTKTVLFQ